MLSIRAFGRNVKGDITMDGHAIPIIKLTGSLISGQLIKHRLLLPNFNTSPFMKAPYSRLVYTYSVVAL